MVSVLGKSRQASRQRIVLGIVALSVIVLYILLIKLHSAAREYPQVQQLSPATVHFVDPQGEVLDLPNHGNDPLQHDTARAGKTKSLRYGRSQKTSEPDAASEVKLVSWR